MHENPKGCALKVRHHTWVHIVCPLTELAPCAKSQRPVALLCHRKSVLLKASRLALYMSAAVLEHQCHAA